MRRQRSGLGIFSGPSAIGDLLPSRTGGQADFDANMAALVDYMNSTPVQTPEAGKIKDDFAHWYANLGFMDLHWNTDQTWQTAFNYRTDFNRANAVTDAQKQAVENVISGGLTANQMIPGVINEGARTTEGKYATPDKPPLSTQTLLILAAVGVGGLYALGKFTTLAQIFAGKHDSKPAPAGALAANGSRRRRARR